MEYQQKNVNVDGLRISGNFYVESGNTFKFEVRPSSIYENTHYLFNYEVKTPPVKTTYSLNKREGILTVVKLSDSYDKMMLRASFDAYQLSGYVKASVEKEITVAKI